MRNQNDIEHLQDLLQRGEITADQANVLMVKYERVRIVNGSVPASVRKPLNAAVKTGDLCHKKKDGRKPEVYYHPSFEHLANAARADEEKKAIEALLAVCI